MSATDPIERLTKAADRMRDLAAASAERQRILEQKLAAADEVLAEQRAQLEEQRLILTMALDVLRKVDSGRLTLQAKGVRDQIRRATA